MEDKININSLVVKLKEIGDYIVKRVEELSQKSNLKESEKNELKKKKDFIKSINDIGFRLLEQTRLGNKDNVFYMLLRCFHSNEEKFPNELVEAFRPENEKYFKTLIFSFLAPILGKEKTGGEE